jgi:cold shock protein
LELDQRTGTIKCWYNGEGGYGFIRPDDGGEAVFVHHTCIAAHTESKSLPEGSQVIYEVARRDIAGLWACPDSKAARQSLLVPKIASTTPARHWDVYADSSPEREGAYPMWQDDESATQPEYQGVSGKDDLELANEVHIPDYVMLDFGFLEGRGTSRKSPA